MKLITNVKDNLLSNIKNSLEECKEFYFIVSFIRFSGIQILLEILKDTEAKGIKGKIITTDYMGITEKRAIESLLKFKNIELKYFKGTVRGFHSKGYIFNYGDKSRVIVGSSNISTGGLKGNIEWNSDILLENTSEEYLDLMDEFNSIWESSLEYDENFIEKRYIEYKSEKKRGLEPNYMQRIALENLKRLISIGGKRALGIAATGTGKTYLAVFHVKEMNPKRVLFIAHRDEILNSAKESFEKVIFDKTMGKYTGKSKELHCEYIFSSIQTLWRNLENFKKDEFDYIIIDEAHHSYGETYEKVINYFKPNFLLGLTATPERSDGNNIYDIFHGNIVMEIRLKEALEHKLVSPFHYFGIRDIEDIDLKDVDLNKIDLVAKKLMIHKRTEFIKDKIELFKFSGNKMKALGFCSNIAHAKYMENEFNSLGIKAVALTGENSSSERDFYIKELEKESSDLKVIFTVDIFNEGVDIPNINLILMLRPTNSPTIFIQQLGRGLRKSSDKEFVTILDFIGNHKKSFLVAMALTGNKSYDKDFLRTSLETDFQGISRDIHVSMDEISKAQILEQIENENFNALKYLKEEYFNFKDFIKRVPNYLDFINYESAPNIYKYILKFKSYYGFLKLVEKDIINFSSKEIKLLEEIESFLPIKRVYEFCILRELLFKKNITIDELKESLKGYLQEVSHKTLIHALDNLNWKFLDDGEKRRKIKLISIVENKINLSEDLLEGIKNPAVNEYIERVILFGLLEYKEIFGDINYGVPFLKPYESYTMKEVALLSNYGKMHSSYRNGINPSEDKKSYYMFINLEKDNGNKFDNIIYNRRNFNWFTKSSTKLDSEVAKNFIYSEDRGVKLYFFMRKFNKIDGITQPFVFVGEGTVIDYEGEKPIKCKIKLKNAIPVDLYKEFIL